MPTLIASALLALLAAQSQAAAPTFVNNQSAAVVVGQPQLTFSGINGTPGVAASGLSTPGGVWSDGTIMVVADTNNHRVLIYNSLPTANGIAADVVIGQPDTASGSANQGGAPADNTLSSPVCVFVDVAGRLYICDRNNNRVLIYNTLPATNNASADVVLGQPTFTLNLANQGGGAPQSMTLSSPAGVYSDGTVLYVADRGNNRVLMYNAIPGFNNAAAAFVVGQASMNVAGVNQGGTPRAFTLSSPASVFSDGVNLFVADQGNNRVLLYNTVPSTFSIAASTVVGQVFMSSNTANQGGVTGSRTLSSPSSVFSDGTRLIIGDTNNNRVLIYPALPLVNNAQASIVVGQSTMSASAANQGFSSPGAATLNRPVAVSFSGTSLFILDQSNNRALIYNVLPGANNAPADLAVGQSNMTTGTANQATTTPGASTSFRPNAARYDGQRLLIADRFNSRVLLFNAAPTKSNAAADVVIGQLQMSSGSANQGLPIAANTLSFPSDATVDSGKVFIADSGNNRILGFNSVPAANNASASFVIGQAAFNAGAANRGLAAPTAQTLSFPTSVMSDGARLVVADRNNHRVLIYNPIPSATSPTAAVVVGQTTAAGRLANQGGAVGASTLATPTRAFSDGARLFVADQANHRVLIYNGVGALGAFNAAANVVVGQPNLTSNAPNQGGGPAANRLRAPSDVYSDGTSLYIADSGNNRILIYNTIPTSNNAAADVVIGESTPTVGSPNQGGPVAPNTLSFPVSVMADTTTGRMFVADSNSNRSLIYEPAVVTSATASGGTLVFISSFGPSQVVAQVPPNAFSQPVTVTFSALTGFPNATSPTTALQDSGVGVQIDLGGGAQPNSYVTLSIFYRNADVVGLDRKRLIIARFDPTTSIWVPLVSVSDPSNNVVTAQTNHFSIFQIMQADPSANTASSVKAFPSPLRPALGANSMTFASAPPYARLRIYTVSGALVKDLVADAAGMAKWDATNSAGANVASGVYFVFVQGGGQSSVLKVGIQR